MLEENMWGNESISVYTSVWRDFFKELLATGKCIITSNVSTLGSAYESTLGWTLKGTSVD